MQHTDPRELLIKVTEILKELRISYIITGGIAVFVWGKPRFTAGIDIVVELQYVDALALEKALQLLGKSGYLDRDVMMDAIENSGEFNFIDGETGVKVDFWVLKNDEFDKSRLKRKKTKTILGKKVYFSSPEDLILIKLRWFSQSSSNKQKEDIESILKISGNKLDFFYLRKMAVKMNLSGELENFLHAFGS